MGIIQRGKQNSGSEENIFWVTMADLLLGLAIIFITLFVLAMTGFSQQNIQQQKVKMEVTEKKFFGITYSVSCELCELIAGNWTRTNYTIDSSNDRWKKKNY